MNRTMLMLLVLLAAAAADVSAQRRELSLEANPIHGTLGYGWVRSPTLTIGVQAGFGFPQFDRTLMPDDESFLDITHIGVFMRARPARSIALDGRIQLGLAELRGCSGCFPGIFTGASAGVFWGGRHVKVGPRITTGVIAEHGESTEFVVNLTPVALLFTYSW
jgi:hypothetical protein